MLRLTIPDQELWYEDSTTRKFIRVKGRTLKLEHSLMSVHKWESKWKKKFISPTPRTREETLSYIACMTLNEDVDPNLYECLTAEDIMKVQAYIDDPMSATIFRGESGGGRKKGKTKPLDTSERIYSAMVAQGIPFDPCQKWHLNQLLALIHQCQVDESGSRVSKRDTARYYEQLNAARRAKHHTRG